MGGSYISATTGELRGIPAAEPVLRLTFDLEAGGLSDGASALFLITGGIRAESGRLLNLGTAAPVLKQLGYEARGGGNVCKTKVDAEWTLSDTAIERIEKIRDGGDLTICPQVQYALISPGSTFPIWDEPQRPIRFPYPGQPTEVRIDAHQWMQNVLEQWHLAAAISLVVALPTEAATDEHRTVISRLTTAKQLLTAGTPDNLKASIEASREACELLRKMRPATINPNPPQRELPEREAFILEKMTEFTQALFNYDSAASHTDPHLRGIVWRRENAVLALGTAASLAQLIFAGT